jgi:hypothetical protein
LTRQERAEVNQLLDRLQTIFNTSRRRANTEFCSATFVLAPLIGESETD